MSEDIGVWQSGKFLVMRRGAELPDRCIKTNQPANGSWFKVTLSWHPSGIYLILLLNFVIYLIVALSVRKTATVHLGVAEAILQKRNKRILYSWIAALVGFASFFASLAFATNESGMSSFAMGTFLIAILLILSGSIFGSSASQLVQVNYIGDEYIWLKGVCQEYLAMLPEWDSE
jgi:hypothetical protein